VVRRSSFGMALEKRCAMPGVKRYEDIEAWQLADALKREVYALTADGPASKGFTFRDQITSSAASSTKNIAEGFGRFNPGDNARFVEISVASTMETKDSLKDGIDRGHFTPERVARAQELAERSIQCSTKDIVYLQRRAKTWGKRRSR
jgi:four helix bundle protein